ncbi:Regulatory protein RecX [bioreactor metagenome]|uniref:Regulatory protein RecX n=1 Tax=bioreactor metagenome TaxID=1076179 RepID=A0A645I5F8_9ZZZZ
MSLHKGQEIDQKLYEIIKDTSLLYLGREYALRQIAISPKTEKTLKLKLKLFFQKIRKKFNLITSDSISIIIDQIISDLNSKNLLNQTDFVSYFINKNRHKSKTQILYLLCQQGIEITPDITSQLSSDGDYQLIEKYFNKKRISPDLLKDFNYRQKLMSSLFRRGFKLSDIKAVIDAFLNLK